MGHQAFWLPKQNLSIASKMLKKELRAFCMSTYNHGFRYFALPMSTPERVFWVVMITISMCLWGVMSVLAWNMIQNSVTNLIIDSTTYPIWNYYFPAITICNFNKISRQKAYEVARHLKRPDNYTTASLAWDLRLLYHLNYLNVPQIPEARLIQTQDILNDNNVDVGYLLQELSPPCTQSLIRCKWKGQHTACMNLFKVTATAGGICCSFNYFAEKSKKKISGRSVIRPRRTCGAGFKTALEVLLYNPTDDYFASTFSSYGHQVIFHNVYSQPSAEYMNQVMAQGTENLFISINPTVVIARDGLRSLKLSERKCVFHDEVFLHSLQYTYYNCLMECRVNLTRAWCGCIPYFYYNPNGTYPKTKICDLKDLPCLYKNKDKLMSSVPGHNMKTIDGKFMDPPRICNCTADCELYLYRVETSAGRLNTKYANSDNFLYNGVQLRNHSLLTVFFDDLIGVRATRQKKWYFHNTIALFGGIAGICTGFNLIGGFEILFALLVRPILHYFAEKRESSRAQRMALMKNRQIVVVKEFNSGILMGEGKRGEISKAWMEC